MNAKLTKTQQEVLTAAAGDGGTVTWMPESATRSPMIAERILEGLLTRGLIERNPHRRERQYRVTGAGYAAIGREKPTKAEHTSATAQNAAHGAPQRERRPRANSKQARVIALLETGATVDQIIAITGWQKHSVRGFFAGALKKQGIRLTSSKTDAGRIYQIDHAAS
jgi:predicted transcriptional regulator